jgi:RNA:NAD 2'-phosphotransferase (TPT1/KptA family)
MAHYDDDSIIVYQAHRNSIADYSVEHQKFGGEFSYTRMSWIKPNFLWMMFRSGWAAKDGQERILAVRLRRSFFDELLESAVASSFEASRLANHAEWQQRHIRASQGYSVEVDLGYESMEPSELLYHGTATRFLDAIRASGLLKMARHHVHLSAETAVTMQVGARHGTPALLTIRAGDMRRAGWEFFRSTNGVWLVDAVPAEFIGFPK